MKTVKLGEITKQINGLWKGKKEPFVNVGVIRNANFTKECTLDLSDVVYLDVQENQFASRKLQKGDLIIEKSGGSDKFPVGRAVPFELETGDYSFSNFTSVLRITNPQEVNYKYLHRYLLYLYKSGYMRSLQSNTIGLHNLDFDKYKEIIVPLPPLSEQTRIVSLLDDAFGKLERSREKALKLLDDAKEIFQAQLKKEMTPKKGWEVKKLGEVCNFQNGFAFKSKLFTPQGLPIVRISDIKDFKISQDNMVFFNPDSYPNQFDSFRVFPEDIVIAMSGGTTGKIGINKTDKVFYLNQRVGKFIPKGNLNRDYLFLFLQTKTEEGLKIAAGSAQPNLSTEQIKNYEIPLPPLSEQSSIVSRLDVLSSQLKQIEEKTNKYLADLDELKQSLLKKAFEGKL